jgi:hypothetical protein
MWRENGAGSWTTCDVGQGGRMESAPLALQPTMAVGLLLLHPCAARLA